MFTHDPPDGSSLKVRSSATWSVRSTADRRPCSARHGDRFLHLADAHVGVDVDVTLIDRSTPSRLTVLNPVSVNVMT
jgi:hypothetical protein